MYAAAVVVGDDLCGYSGEFTCCGSLRVASDVLVEASDSEWLVGGTVVDFGS